MSFFNPLSERSSDEWIAAYERSHQHPVNRACHTVGIPMIVLSLLMLPALFWLPHWYQLPVALFVVGWVLQFVGHAMERKPPEFLHDWRFLLVGLRWWLAKVSGRV